MYCTLFATLSVLVEAPVGVGFSYSLTKSEYITNDTKTASDNFVFVQKWLEAFPEYKSNELYITYVVTSVSWSRMGHGCTIANVGT